MPIASKHLSKQMTLEMFWFSGAGVMGLELAENFHHLGMDVTLVDHLPQVAYPYDEEIADLIYDKLVENNLKVQLNTEIKEIRRNRE